MSPLFPILRTKQTQISQMLLMTLIFQSSAIFVALLCTFNQFNVLLVVNTVLEMWSHKCQRPITPLALLAAQTRMPFAFVYT